MTRSPTSDDQPLIRPDGDDHHAMAVFTRDVMSVSSARAWLTQFLDGHHVRSTISADASLILSELVTNALRHGMGDIVTLGSLDGDQVRVSVIDSGDDLPPVVPASPGRVGGLGLHVVGRVERRGRRRRRISPPAPQCGAVPSEHRLSSDSE
jgi:anti-sigma regulatory factor (Ser/Thr protein kinase)